MPHAWLNGTFKIVVRDEKSEDVSRYLNYIEYEITEISPGWGETKKSASGRECKMK